jgi:hypothetical protein
MVIRYVKIIWGAKGRPATPTYKISATYMDGYKVCEIIWGDKGRPATPTYKISATYMDGYKVPVCENYLGS